MKKKPLLTHGINPKLPTLVDMSRYEKHCVWTSFSDGWAEVYYTDKQGKRQIRFEFWSDADLDVWKLLNVHGVKDNEREGEQIVLTWP
ncbi:MAG TPA: hypothetical protein VMX17_11285 [Candidatus Glassbacteria bacterium]|nr:hypothetical protein [Candidatus Glassbacteria bacterium]